MSRKPKHDERFRVLVVDDHASAREAVADVLRQAEYDVIACASASEALGKLAAGKIRRCRHRSANARHERARIHLRNRAPPDRCAGADDYGPRIGVVGGRSDAARCVRLHRKAVRCCGAGAIGCAGVRSAAIVRSSSRSDEPERQSTQLIQLPARCRLPLEHDRQQCGDAAVA